MVLFFSHVFQKHCALASLGAFSVHGVSTLLARVEISKKKNPELYITSLLNVTKCACYAWIFA